MSVYNQQLLQIQQLKQRLQQKACNLFRYRDEDWELLNGYKFKKVLGYDNVMKVAGIELFNKLQDMKEVLEETKEELEKSDVQYMEDEEGELCKIFDMGENIIAENKWWVYDYEIEEYYEMIKEKIMEYVVLVKEIEDDIQTDKEVYYAISRALLRC